MDEQWEYIRGVQGYMISDKGRVWSEKTQKFIKPKPMDNHGHLGVSLMSGGKHIYRYIHRLIAEAFMPNPDNLPIVRHLDDDPSENHIDNLAWGTQRDNSYDAIRYGTAYMLTDEDREKGFAKCRTPIKAIHVDTGRVYEFRGQNEASKELNIPQANIFKVLNNQRTHAKGYKFEYLEPRGGYR